MQIPWHKYIEEQTLIHCPQSTTLHNGGYSPKRIWRKVEQVTSMQSNGRRATHVMAVLLAAMFLCLPSNAKAQLSDERARHIARETVRSSTQRDNAFFSVHRREDLEDAFYSLRGPQDGVFHRDPHIFEVSDQGYEFKKDSIEYHLSVHGPFVYFLAVASGSGEVFRIAGFRDSQKEFNRLARFYKVRLGNEIQAREYADLYLRLDPLNNRTIRTPSLLLLKQLAESRFDDNYKEFASAESHFDRWWEKHERALGRISFAEDITKTEGGFVLSFLTMSSIDKNSSDNGPAPLRVTLALSSDGQVEKPAFVAIELQ